MARKLKITLEDGKQYTFGTLTRRQTLAVQKAQATRPSYLTVERLQQKEKEEGIDEVEMEEMEDAQVLEEHAFYEVIRMSLQKVHPEFALQEEGQVGDGEEDFAVAHNKAAIDKIQDIMDIQTIQITSGFAISGVVELQSEAELSLGDIVLS